MLQLAQVSTASESNPCARQPQDKVRENGTGKNEGKETEKNGTEDMRNLTLVFWFCVCFMSDAIATACAGLTRSPRCYLPLGEVHRSKTSASAVCPLWLLSITQQHEAE